MKKIIVLVSFSMIFLLLMLSCSEKISFDHYGVYVKSTDGFKEIKGYDWSGYNDVYAYSRNYDDTQIQYEEILEIYVYLPISKSAKYKLILPNSKTQNGDFKCANFGFGRNCPEFEFIITPIENEDNMIKISSQLNSYSGALILHIGEESKGYIFNSKNISFKENEMDNSKKEIEEEVDPVSDERQSIVSILQTYGAQVMQYYRTPSSQGGAGSNIVTGDALNIVTFLGWESTTMKTEIGTFTVTVPSRNTVKIVGVGNEIGNDGVRTVSVTTTVTCADAAPLSTSINN